MAVSNVGFEVAFFGAVPIVILDGSAGCFPVYFLDADELDGPEFAFESHEALKVGSSRFSHFLANDELRGFLTENFEYAGVLIG